MQQLAVPPWLLVALACVGSVAGCNKGLAPEQARPSPKSSELPVENAEKAPTQEASRPTTCTFDGTYRFRFFSNGHQGWWFRFSVAGETATLLEPVTMLSLQPGPLKLTLQRETCSLTVSASSSNAGEVSVDLGLNMVDSTVSGALVREKAHNDNEKRVDVSGVHNAQGSSYHSACIRPGIYSLVFNSELAWKTEDSNDDRDCTQAPQYASPMFVKVEPYGVGVAVSLRDPEPPYAERWASDSVVQTGECRIELELVDTQGASLKGGLTFSHQGITGVAKTASYQFVEDGTAGENIWTCIGTDVPLKGTLVE